MTKYISSDSERVSKFQKSLRKRGYKNVSGLISPELYSQYIAFRKLHRLRSLKDFLDYIISGQYLKELKFH